MTTSRGFWASHRQRLGTTHSIATTSATNTHQIAQSTASVIAWTGWLVDVSSMTMTGRERRAATITGTLKKRWTRSARAFMTQGRYGSPVGRASVDRRCLHPSALRLAHGSLERDGCGD